MQAKYVWTQQALHLSVFSSLPRHVTCAVVHIQSRRCLLTQLDGGEWSWHAPFATLSEGGQGAELLWMHWVEVNFCFCIETTCDSQTSFPWSFLSLSLWGYGLPGFNASSSGCWRWRQQHFSKMDTCRQNYRCYYSLNWIKLSSSEFLKRQESWLSRQICLCYL